MLLKHVKHIYKPGIIIFGLMSWLCITQVKKTPKQRAEEESLWGLLAAKFIHTFLPWLISAVLFVLYKNTEVCDKGIDNLTSEYAVDRRNFLNDLKRNSISEYLFLLWKGRESWKGIGQVCACVCVWWDKADTNFKVQ